MVLFSWLQLNLVLGRWANIAAAAGDRSRGCRVFMLARSGGEAPHQLSRGSPDGLAVIRTRTSRAITL